MLDQSVVTAGELMTRDVAVVHPGTSLLDAVKLMAARKVSGLPVVDEAGAVVGVVSEGDLLRWHEGYAEQDLRWVDMLAEGLQPASALLEEIYAARNKVAAVMAKGAVSVDEATPAREIADLMYREGIKRVPVLRDGTLVGIVARSDLVRAVAARLDEAPQAGAEPPPARTVDEALRRGREEAVKGVPHR